MTHNIYIYILIMGGISYFIRVLPIPTEDETSASTKQ